MNFREQLSRYGLTELQRAMVTKMWLPLVGDGAMVKLINKNNEAAQEAIEVFKELINQDISNNNPYDFSREDAYEVCSICANSFDVEVERLFQKDRHREVVNARNVAMYIMRYRYRINYEVLFPLQKVGNYLLKDHSSVIHSINKFKDNFEFDAIFRNKAKPLISELIPDFDYTILTKNL